MFRGYADFKYRPCPLLRKYVASGYLGKKNRKGILYLLKLYENNL
jgi:3-hydroxybutyryl-CoA dehydrogenase